MVVRYAFPRGSVGTSKLKNTVAKIDRLWVDIDVIVAEVEGAENEV